MKKFNPVLPRLIQFGKYYCIANPCATELYSVITADVLSKAGMIALAERGLVYRTKEEAVRHALSLISPGIELIRQMSQDPDSTDDEYGEDDDEYDEDNYDDDDDICALCDGTGEGQFDGQRCTRCRGRGY